MNNPFSEREINNLNRDQPARTRQIEWIGAALLFIATALIVLWQNRHLAVLWDLSYVLDTSYRISCGQVLYRDFPFVHAPLTFLTQAAIIKLGGLVFWHHVLYCTVVGGVATVLTWRNLRNVLREMPHWQLIAFLLALPLAPLGIYSVFPHPFYDPDCTLTILVSLLLLQHVERRPLARLYPFIAGASLVIPLFAKQNTGLAFLLAALGLIILLAIWERMHRRSCRYLVLIIAGAMFALGVSMLVVHFTAGLRNYWHWTMQFAAARRTPARSEMLAIYINKINLLWLAFVAAGALVWRRARNGRLVWSIVGAALVAAPFVWPAIYLLRDPDPSERADRLLNVWAVVIVASFVIAILSIRRRAPISRALPFITIAAINGCFMSQQLWGSTYAIWPLLMILVADALASLAPFVAPKAQPRNARAFVLISTTLIVASLLVAGTAYVRSHERLSYANLDEGALNRSTLPQLRGLTTRGDWIPNFEELIQYANKNIPPDEGVILLPGEDPFYYVTGRQPQFPVLLFDQTGNPYSPEEIRQLCRERNIRWLIVKQDLQNEDDAVDQEKDRITEALEQDFEQVESLKNYDIYRRNEPEAGEEDNEPN